VSSDPSFEEQEALKQTVSSLEELRLKEQLQRSERELEELEHELQAIEGELEAQIEKGERYEVLSRLCENFEELDKVGASYLFWGDLERPENTARHLESVRGKINEFTDDIARIEDRRDAVLDKIGDKNRTMDYLYYDLRDATEREESRKAEWLRTCRPASWSCPGRAATRKMRARVNRFCWRCSSVLRSAGCSTSSTCRFLNAPS
jgi:chromosome segregation ATPase